MIALCRIILINTQTFVQHDMLDVITMPENGLQRLAATHRNETRWLRTRDLISVRVCGRDLVLINVPTAALVVCLAAHTRNILEDHRR